ncbi:membrane protein [Pseudomonas sp. M47T1]|uniref:LapA family protein n=1 Tax=Pseudomonas sp. M47T1 TaxID=1179778 RepID=UPI000260803F|nr:membrane protein [Pseudomonas sp. M47T1]
MRNLKRLLLGLIVLVVMAVVVVFMLENQQPASLVFFGYSLPQLPVSIFVMLAFLVGLVIGPVLSVVIYMRKSKRVRYHTVTGG